MKDTLSNRLRGNYAVGPDGVYGIRSFAHFIPPISIEAADRIDELEDAMLLIQSAHEVSENPLSLIENICAEANVAVRRQDKGE